MEPLLSWGLPATALKPLELFQHSYECLADKKGILIFSSPSMEEFEIGLVIAHQAGFHEDQKIRWEPKNNSAQKKPRLGAIFTI